MLLEGVDDETAALVVAHRITAAMAEPIRRFGGDLSVTASVGVAITRAGEQVGVDELITRADAAMYEAKRGGGSTYTVFPTSTARQRERLKESSKTRVEAIPH